MKRKFLSVIIAACLAITSLTSCNTAKITPIESETSSVSSAVDTVTVPSIPDGTTIDPSVDVSQQSFYSLFSDLGLKVNLKPISPSSNDDKPNTVAYSKPYEGSEVEKDSVVTVYYFKDTTTSSTTSSTPSTSDSTSYAATKNTTWVDGTKLSGKITEFDNPNYVLIPNSVQSGAKYSPLTIKKIISDENFDCIEMTYLVQSTGQREYHISMASINKDLIMAPESTSFNFDNKTGTIIPGVPLTIYERYARNSTQLIDRNGNLTKEISLNLLTKFGDSSFSTTFLFELK